MTATRTEQVRIRVTPEELIELRRRAEQDGRSVSGYLRRLAIAAERERVERIEREQAGVRV